MGIAVGLLRIAHGIERAELADPLADRLGIVEPEGGAQGIGALKGRPDHVGIELGRSVHGQVSPSFGRAFSRPSRD